MKRGYLLAAMVFVVVFCLVLVGCPKKQGPPPGGMGMPGKGMMKAGENPAANAEANAEENVEANAEENVEANAEENAEAAGNETSIPTPADKPAKPSKK